MTDDATKTDVLTAKDEKLVKLAEDRRCYQPLNESLAALIHRLEGEVLTLQGLYEGMKDLRSVALKGAEKAEAAAAELREALDVLHYQQPFKDSCLRCTRCGVEKGSPCHDFCIIGKALSGDAGKALLAEVGTLRAVKGAATAMHGKRFHALEECDRLWNELEQALDAADANAAERGMETMGFTRKDGE